MRILIIRHGDPDYEHDSLTLKGKKEAELLANWLENEKIDAIYSSPLGRAKLTCKYTADKKGMGFEIFPWLQEFAYPVVLPTGQRHLIWDLLPEFWTNIPEMYDSQKWLDIPFIKEAGIKERYEEVVKGLDDLLEKHGYKRDGKIYHVERENTETIALFCHFGIETILLSHLFNVSPMILSHHFVALPTSITTLYTEERREGKATFRCSGFGETGHLKSNGEPCSFAARFKEVYHSNDRED